MSKKLALGLGLALALVLPVVGCLGSPFATGGGGTGTGTSTASSGGGGTTTTTTSTGSTSTTDTGSTSGSTTTSSTTTSSGCKSTETLCGTKCVDTQKSEAHCGKCDNKCGSGATCEAGVCTCTDPLRDHCGSDLGCILTNTKDHCGSTCAACTLSGDTCTLGKCTCTTPGHVGDLDCAGTCVNDRSDPLNCGGCGTPCDVTQACAAGTCVCRPGFKACGADCVSTLTDPGSCGTCGHVCNGTTPKCSNGTCVAECQSGEFCSTSGETGYCLTDQLKQNDPTNCGGCGKKCQPNEVCAAGNCHTYKFAPSCAQCLGGWACCQGPAGASWFCVEGNVCPVLQ